MSTIGGMPQPIMVPRAEMASIRSGISQRNTAKAAQSVERVTQRGVEAGDPDTIEAGKGMMIDIAG